MNRVELTTRAWQIEQCALLQWPHNSMDARRSERVSLRVSVVDSAIIAEVAHADLSFKTQMRVAVDCPIEHAAVSVLDWARPYADIQSPQVAAARAATAQHREEMSRKATEARAEAQRREAWLTESSRIIARLERVGWGGTRPHSLVMEWRSQLAYAAVTLERVRYAYPDLPSEADVRRAEQMGQESAAVARWVREGGDILLCLPDQVAEADASLHFGAIHNGAYAHSQSSGLYYAFGYGLYAYSSAPTALTRERAEQFRQRVLLRRSNSSGGDEKTSVEADGFWHK